MQFTASSTFDDYRHHRRDEEELCIHVRGGILRVYGSRRPTSLTHCLTNRISNDGVLHLLDSDVTHAQPPPLGQQLPTNLFRSTIRFIYVSFVTLSVLMYLGDLCLRCHADRDDVQRRSLLIYRRRLFRREPPLLKVCITSTLHLPSSII